MFKKIYTYIDGDQLLLDECIERGSTMEKNGADGIFLSYHSTDDKEKDEFLMVAKQLIKEIHIPIILKNHIRSFEDVKKALYTGASYVVIPYHSPMEEVVIESIKRFQGKIILEVSREWQNQNEEIINELVSLGLYGILTEEITREEGIIYPIIHINKDREQLVSELHMNSVVGIVIDNDTTENIYVLKQKLKEASIAVNLLESSLEFKTFKLNGDGLIPVVTQDFKTHEVLMLAYMNEEAFQNTIKTGKMTYYSRSRNELWVKGETSGHYQYVMSLDMDCDKDTILAKVNQIASACHTGNRSCFYTNLIRRDYEEGNPLTVLNQVFNVIKDRKLHPKEGSYTNYLFDKGIDKILKKCGEEVTEIVIAAKNPNKEELKYEISDFLYHMMVLMVECNVDWDDIINELSNR